MGNLTLTELSTQKEMLLAKCKYNALSDCFVLCIKNKYLLQLLAKGISDLAQMVEDCLFGAEVFVFAPC